MRIGKFLFIMALIIWACIWWHSWSEWAKVLNIGVIALSMVNAVCQTIRDIAKDAQ